MEFSHGLGNFEAVCVVLTGSTGSAQEVDLPSATQDLRDMFNFVCVCVCTRQWFIYWYVLANLGPNSDDLRSVVFARIGQDSCRAKSMVQR